VEAFIESLKNGDAVQLPNPREINLIPPSDVMEGYRVLLNGEFVGETKARTPFVFSTSLIENVLSVESYDGQKSLPLFFKVMHGEYKSFLYIGLDNHNNLAILLSPDIIWGNTVNGIKKLKPVLSDMQCVREHP
jgi:hypothetical protein